MALDFTGIENVEFYSGHYLDAVLEGDLKVVFNKWKRDKDENGTRQPQEKLAALANKYFSAYGKAASEPDEVERLDLARDFHAHLLEALGYERSPSVEPLDGDEVVPVHLSLRRDGNPFLWVIDTPFTAREDDDPLDQRPHPDQLPADSKDANLPHGDGDTTATWRSLLDERIFRMEHSPRWVLVLSGREALLAERHKWPQGKYLRFRLGELFQRKQASALRALAGLLHKDVLAPDSGVCLHDTLDENSHKHAYAVSADLKHGVRRSVELLANEVVYYRREVQKLGVFNDEEFASKLTSECLTWMYRLLFLFYVEARGSELGVVPMKAEPYRKGYSLESLRDLELVSLTTEHAQNGTFIHDSVRTLFRILNAGFPTAMPEQIDAGLDDTYHDTMVVDALNSPLFDDERFEILKNVRFRNFVLQEVLQLLSLSAEKKRKARGRISYAQLGINQLGAVYEGLLSYTGFFATEDLYEVASAKDAKQLSGKSASEREALKTYFVPASRIEEYEESEIVRDEHDRKVVHPKGTFIFRLAGRNREKSASYYTPEVLTKCLVKYALKELFIDEDGNRRKTADEILGLTICEPAMGSSAFLIEAVDQLADHYLETRQNELDESISPEEYQKEKRRVKARLATNNCYGVDLNPTAVELAKVSLWLATVYEGGKCPWFGLRLATGNSLVGARREVFKTADVIRPNKKDNPNWLGLVPEPVPLFHGSNGAPFDERWTVPSRPEGTIYHFLLPAEGMAAFDKDKVIEQLAPESVKRIKEWRREFCKPFQKKDAERLERISDAVDRLFAQVVRERALATQETSDRIPVWGEPSRAQQADLLVRDQEEVAATLEDGSSAYRRLKLAMDAWCALWFWPIEESGLLPDRTTWLAQLELILRGQVTREAVWKQQNLFATVTHVAEADLAQRQGAPGDVATLREANADRLKRLQVLSDAFQERRSDYLEECGLTDIGSVLEGDAGLHLSQTIAERLRFHHWELRFAEVFARANGFDLLVGNPPWVKLEWNEKAFLSDFHPYIGTRAYTATKVARDRGRYLSAPTLRESYLQEFVDLSGVQEFIGSKENFHLLEGQPPNLYKCFIVRGLQIGSSAAVLGLLHPHTVFEYGKGGALRARLYRHLSFHFYFENRLLLFSEIKDTRKFTLCVYSLDVNRPIKVRHIAGLYHPSTIDACFSHDGQGRIPGRKTDDNAWDLRGHLRRIVKIEAVELELFRRVFDPTLEDAQHGRLPLIFSREMLSALRAFGNHPKRIGDLGEAYSSTGMWDEKSAQDSGTIVKGEMTPPEWWQAVISGPHIYVGNVLYQTASDPCSSPQHYRRIDLKATGEAYRPCVVYSASTPKEQYKEALPQHEGAPITDSFRLAARRMVDPGSERSLVAALLPRDVAHIDTVFSVAMLPQLLVFQAAAWFSLPFDFWVKSTGKTDFRRELADLLPLVEDSAIARLAVIRAARLSCLSTDFSELWSSVESLSGQSHRPCCNDARLEWSCPLGTTWNSSTPLFTDLERRQALVEIDCLISMILGLSVDELVTIYMAQFPTLVKNERLTLYDQDGRCVATAKNVLGDVGVSLVELAATLKEQAGFDVHAEYPPDRSNTQELRKQTIRLGKKEADVLGVSERCTMADLLAETEVRWSDEDHPEGRPVRLVGLRYTDPGLEPRMERVYPTPWTRCDREEDYRVAWAEFERRLGKKMPEGAPSLGERGP